jgi:hypothetical protein
MKAVTTRLNFISRESTTWRCSWDYRTNCKWHILPFTPLASSVLLTRMSCNAMVLEQKYKNITALSDALLGVGTPFFYLKMHTQVTPKILYIFLSQWWTTYKRKFSHNKLFVRPPLFLICNGRIDKRGNSLAMKFYTLCQYKLFTSDWTVQSSKCKKSIGCCQLSEFYNIYLCITYTVLFN